MYSSIDLVREISGFQNTTNIPDSKVRGKIEIADSMVKGSLAHRYRLPLSYHPENHINISGEAAEAGTISVVVNSQNFSIDVELGEGAADIADKLRLAMRNNGAFITDPVTSGVAVTLIAIKDSDLLVEANAAVTVGTITNPVDGVVIGVDFDLTKRFPPLVRQLSASIAAGLLLIDNYGVEQQGTSLDGTARVDEAVKILASIQGKKDIYTRVTDEITEQEIAQDARDGAASYPDSDLVNDTEESYIRVSIDQKF